MLLYCVVVNDCYCFLRANDIQQILIIFLRIFCTSGIIHPGSGENHMVYFYKRTNPLCTPLPTAPKVIIPKRVGFDEEDEEVVCDPSFLSAIKLAVGPIEGKFAQMHNISRPYFACLCVSIPRIFLHDDF